MNMGPVDPEQVIQTFTRRRLNQKVLNYVAFFGFAFTIITRRYSDPTLTGLPASTELVIGLLVGFGALLYSYFNWRCPACRKFLGIKSKLTACPKCRAQFKK